jgi:hypothetical protein
MMISRTATCQSGQLRATCHGEPVRVSVCHCLARQKRSGSAFAVQARWRDDDVEISGSSKIWSASPTAAGKRRNGSAKPAVRPSPI